MLISQDYCTTVCRLSLYTTQHWHEIFLYLATACSVIAWLHGCVCVCAVCNVLQAFSLIQATLSSEIMSAVTRLDCWDVLLTAASACCIQLLHDASDGIYIAVGYTVRGFCELERMLLSLLTGIVSSHVTDRTETDTVHLHADNSISSSSREAELGSAAVGLSSIPQMSSTLELGGTKSGDFSAGTEAVSDLLAGDIKPQSESSLQDSVHYKNTDMQLQTSFQEVPDDSSEIKTETVITRSGRRVKSKNFADFTSSGTSVKDSAPIKKSSTKRRRGQSCKPTTDDCSNGIQCLENVDQTSVISQQQDAVVASSAQQHANEHQSHETAASDIITEHGNIIYYCIV